MLTLFQVNNRPFYHYSTVPLHADGAHEVCRPPKRSISRHSSPRPPTQDRDAREPSLRFRAQTVHTKCAVHPNDPSPVIRLPVLRPKTGTQCDTSATYLRKQNSKLPLKRPTPDTGQCTRMCTAGNCAKDGAFAGNPAPHSQELERLVCSAS